ncbi:hypothetical protein U9M48_020531 [Paspalum notatum var. saurae]|uniref:Uncharacterized protein n=1 Tax=Paspalum notatum var. saurae TaxID=547442 RepID=A0AAQ3TGB1_PASNO
MVSFERELASRPPRAASSPSTTCNTIATPPSTKPNVLGRRRRLFHLSPRAPLACTSAIHGLIVDRPRRLPPYAQTSDAALPTTPRSSRAHQSGRSTLRPSESSRAAAALPWVRLRFTTPHHSYTPPRATRPRGRSSPLTGTCSQATRLQVRGPSRVAARGNTGRRARFATVQRRKKKRSCLEPIAFDSLAALALAPTIET